jgi:hypothetical protein
MPPRREISLDSIHISVNWIILGDFYLFPVAWYSPNTSSSRKIKRYAVGEISTTEAVDEEVMFLAKHTTS